MAKRRKYSEEFKREAVGLIRQPGASVSEVAGDIGVGANLLFRWRREFEGEGKKAFPLSANVRETRSTQRIRVGRRQRKRTCWDCEREWKRMVVPLEPGRPSEARVPVPVSWTSRRPNHAAFRVSS